MLAYDPAKRISAKDALQHKWIKEKAIAEKVTQHVASKTLSNLKNFKAQEKMKTATLAFIASQLVTKEETKDLEKMFKQIDKDGDANLSK